MGEKYYDGAKKTMVYIDAQFYLEELKMTANYVTEEVYIQGCLLTSSSLSSLIQAFHSIPKISFSNCHFPLKSPLSFSSPSYSIHSLIFNNSNLDVRVEDHYFPELELLFSAISGCSLKYSLGDLIINNIEIGFEE